MARPPEPPAANLRERINRIRGGSDAFRAGSALLVSIIISFQTDPSVLDAVAAGSLSCKRR